MEMLTVLVVRVDVADSDADGPLRDPDVLILVVFVSVKLRLLVWL